MEQFPSHIRARLMELGELSRPLGEARATGLAREIALSVLLDLQNQRDVHTTLDAYKKRLERDIEQPSPVPQRKRSTRSRTSWSDLLPEFPAGL
jgi:hypothetical protein